MKVNNFNSAIIANNIFIFSTKSQQVASLLLTILTTPAAVVSFLIMFLQTTQSSDSLISFIPITLVFIICLALIMCLIKNIKKPNTYTLLIELVFVISVYSNNNYTEQSINKNGNWNSFIDHMKHLTNEQYDLIAGFKMDMEGPLLICLFYLFNIAIHQLKKRNQKR